MILSWRTVPYERHKFLVVGTILAATFVEGCGKRFAIYEQRTRLWDETENKHYPSTTYCVKDAERSSYEDAKTGKLPPTVFRSDDLDAAVAFIKGHSNSPRRD